MKRYLWILLCAMLFLCGCELDTTDHRGQYVEHKAGQEGNLGSQDKEKGGVSTASMEVHLPNSAGGQVIVRYVNRNDHSVAVSTDLCFYNGNGNTINVVCEKVLCIPAGKTSYQVFESDTGFSSYSYDWTVTNAAKQHEDEYGHLKLVTERDSSGQLCYSVSNSWEGQLEAVLTIYYFREDSSLAGYDKQQIHVDGYGGIRAGTFAQPANTEYVIYADYLNLQ